MESKIAFSQGPQKTRDIANFLNIRLAHPGDDLAIGELLLRTFVQTYEKKLPKVATCTQRRRDLLNVTARRRGGVVCVLELGYRIVGTFSLIHPDSPECEAWIPEAANLRCVAIDPEFQGYRFSDFLLKSAVDFSQEWGIQCICLHVQAGANSVAKLYQSFGFSRDPHGDKICFGFGVEGYSLYLNQKALVI